MVADLLAKLKKLGKPQTAAIYKRFGSGDNVFGTLTSEIGKLRKTVGTDHDLALKLWGTGNAEARILALQVADPEKLSRSEAESMAQDPGAHFCSYYLSELVAKSPIAADTMRAWMKSPKEFVRETGYGILGFRLKDAADTISDAEAKRALETIEREIHAAPNFARHAMNNAVIAIGTYKPALRDQAMETARRIGKVEVDHGETSCKTPDAAAAIAKAKKRKRCP
jgi:3-methyladenine DNA glycosylase AlkD